MIKSSNNLCYICGKSGHYAKACTEHKKIVCSRCKGIGHYANQCPKYPPKYPCKNRCKKCNQIGHYANQCSYMHKDSKYSYATENDDICIIL
jgi:hypothetical protein